MVGGLIGSCECCKIYIGIFRKNKNKNKKNEIFWSEVIIIEIEDLVCDFWWGFDVLICDFLILFVNS